MKIYVSTLFLSLALLSLMISGCSVPPASLDSAPADEIADAEKPDQITVAYFLEWPTANQVAQVEALYDERMGIKVNWVAFDTGTAMSAAMASGDVQIAYSQGLVPFTLAVSQGLPLKLVGVAVSYAENDNCVVHEEAGITQENAKDLEGKKVSAPLGTVAHYKMLRTLDHLGVEVNNLDLVDLAPADGAAALGRGDVVMACGWGGALGRMKDYGQVLMTAAEQEAIGIRVFDVISVIDDFATEYPDLVVDFLQVTEEANLRYAADPEAAQPIIAEAAGMSLEASKEALDLFIFPTKEEQLSEAWMAGTVQSFIKEVADFFVEQGEMETALDDYSDLVDPSFYEQVE